MNIQEALTAGKAGKVIGRGEASFPTKDSIFYVPTTGDGLGTAGLVLDKLANEHFPSSIVFKGWHIQGGWFHCEEIDGYIGMVPHHFTDAEIMADDWLVLL